MNDICDTIIIGGGIAGITAGIYAARKKMKHLLITENIGGQTTISGEILNYPGIVKTNGLKFSKALEEQTKVNNIKIKQEKVTKIKKCKDYFQITTNKSKYKSKTIILATGARPRKLNISGEDKYAKKGVTYCSICDGPLFAKKDVAILGGGNAALEAVDFLTNIAKKIYLIIRNDTLIGNQTLQEGVKNNKKVKIIYNANSKEILGDRFVSELKYNQEGKDHNLKVQGIIIEIGRVPNTEDFEDIVKLDEHGHILIDCQTRTSVPGIFAAGDCTSGHEYQYTIAAGQGSMALIKAAKYINQNGD